MVRERFLFYILAIAAIFFIISSISGMLLPFVLAAVLAYLLDPLVDKLEEYKINRGITSGAIVALMFFLIFLMFSMAIPFAVDAFEDLDYLISNYDVIYNNKILPIIHPFLPSGIDLDYLKVTMQTNSQEIIDFSIGWLKAIALSTMKVFDLVSIFLIMPLALYYFLKDWDKILGAMHSLVPQNDQNYVSVTLSKMNVKLSSFIRGQLLVCLILGAFYGIGLSLIGLKLGFVIGMLTGLLSFIPFAGMFLGTAVAFIMALIQFPLADIEPFALIGIVFIIGQLLESSVLSPKLVGDALGLHPMWIIFAVMAGGHVGGFLGILIALPMAAIITVLLQQLIAYYKTTNIYMQSIAKPKKATKKQKKD